MTPPESVTNVDQSITYRAGGLDRIRTRVFFVLICRQKCVGAVYRKNTTSEKLLAVGY